MLFKHNILNGIWFIERSFANNYTPFIARFMKNPTAVTDRQPESFLSFHDGYETDIFIDDLKDAPQGSVAIINIAGAITKHDQDCGPDGMTSKASALEACYAADNIDGVVLRIESGGGEAMAWRLFAETLSLRNKPVVAFIEDLACSAAYGIAAACDHVVANSALAQVGSIGTYYTFFDDTEYFEKMGVKLTHVYASAAKDKNHETREALKGNFEPLRKLADKFNESFVDAVEESRGDKLVVDRSIWGTGKTWFAEEALKLGLIDEINTFTNTLNSFVHE